MLPLRRPLLACLIAATAALPAWSAFAAPPAKERPQQGRGSQVSEDGQRPRADDALSDAVRRIERSTRGQVLSAERMQSDGRDVNRIKVVDDRGRVRIYMDDPQKPRGRPPTRDDDE
jgi:hypothetical protein